MKLEYHTIEMEGHTFRVPKILPKGSEVEHEIRPDDGVEQLAIRWPIETHVEGEE